MVLDENGKLIPQEYGRHLTDNDIDNLHQADLYFSKSLFEYVCDILENNKEIILDSETLKYLLDRDPKPTSSAIEGHYDYRTFNYNRLTKIIKENQTLKKSNISLDNIYQILIQTFQLNNEDVFRTLVTPEEFNKNHEEVNIALLDYCYAKGFVEITNIIRKFFDKDYDRLAIAKLRNNNNFCEKVIIELINSNMDEEDIEFIIKILTDDDIEIDYNFQYSDTTLKEVLALNNHKLYIKEL